MQRSGAGRKRTSTVDGDDTSDRTGSESGHDTSEENEVRALSGRLEGTTDHGEEGRVHDTVDTTPAVSEPTADETTDDTSQVCDERNNSQQEFGEQREIETHSRY